jgi:hypothetical protein
MTDYFTSWCLVCEQAIPSDCLFCSTNCQFLEFCSSAAQVDVMDDLAALRINTQKIAHEDDSYNLPNTGMKKPLSPLPFQCSMIDQQQSFSSSLSSTTSSNSSTSQSPGLHSIYPQLLARRKKKRYRSERTK